MQLTFLEAYRPLTKTFTKTKTGIEKSSYPLTQDFTTHFEVVKDLAQFETALVNHAVKGHCLLKGTPSRPLVKESRAGTTDSGASTEWICLDFDGAPLQSIQYAMTVLGMKDVSYIVQHSASSGIEGDKSIRAHVFVLLDKPLAAPLLKQWLIHLNHQTPELRNAMSLTSSGMAIKWPLDVSACQNDKLIYIAPPVLKGIADPFKGKPRITLIRGKTERYAIPGGFSTEKNKDLTHRRVAELREAADLPKRVFKYKVQGGFEVMVKPDECTITEMKTERGFVYFNLNGGDSWAYYHPENNFDHIHNFKGEPVYLTKELLPEYWEQITSQTTKVDSNGLMYLAFCDRKTSGYWRGTYDAATDTLDLNQAKNETQIRHFAKQHGVPLGDYIPEWDLMFNPKDSANRVDVQNKIVNTFSPSLYMKTMNLKVPTKIPPTIFKIIHHVLGSDPDITEHFINWLSFIVRERDRTQTAWVLHGTEGTGKGLLKDKILRPMLGESNVVDKRMEELSEQYNLYMRDALLVIVDEVQTSALVNESTVMAKLRNAITEERIAVRAMFQNSYHARNYTNWIFNSNKSDPVSIPANDRRHNVAKYQPNRLQITNKEVDRIESELSAFFAYLAHYPCDHDKARSVIHTKDRETMISISQSSIDTVADHLLAGDFEFLMDQLPASTAYQSDFASLNKLENYKHVLRALIGRVTAQGRTAVSRDELRVMFDFIIGGMPQSPNKFTSLLKHHRIHMDKVWVDKTVNGIYIKWKHTAAELAAFEAQLAPNNKVVPITKAAAKKSKAA